MIYRTTCSLPSASRWGGGPDHAVEFPHRPARMEAGAGVGERQHGGIETCQSRALDDP